MTNEQASRRFKYFIAKGLEVKQDEDGTKSVTVPIQSLQEDRDGDRITEEGQKVLIEQLGTGKVPAFPNHGMGDSRIMYDYREIMGKWVGGYTQDGITYGELQLRENNEAAEALKDLIEQDMPVGFSIGFIPKGCDEEEGTEGMAIYDLDLLETSPVGIPSNAAAVHGNARETAMAAKGVIENKGGREEIKEALKRYVNKSDEDGEKQLNQLAADLEQVKADLTEMKELLKNKGTGDHKMTDEEPTQEPQEQDAPEEESKETPEQEEEENSEEDKDTGESEDKDEQPGEEEASEEDEDKSAEIGEDESDKNQEPEESLGSQEQGSEEEDKSNPRNPPKKMKTAEYGEDEDKNLDGQIRPEEPQARGFRFRY